MNNNDVIKFVDEDGNVKVYNVVFSFDNVKNGKTYVIVTDKKTNEKGEFQLYPLKFDSSLDVPKYEKVDSEEELKDIEDVIKKIQEKLRYE